jgi:hypothetical protein
VKANLPLELYSSLLVEPSHQHGRYERAELAAGVQTVNHVLEASRHQLLTSDETVSQETK